MILYKKKNIISIFFFSLRGERHAYIKLHKEINRTSLKRQKERKTKGRKKFFFPLLQLVQHIVSMCCDDIR